MSTYQKCCDVIKKGNDVILKINVAFFSFDLWQKFYRNSVMGVLS